MKIRIEFNLPEGMDRAGIIEEIYEQTDLDRESGRIQYEGFDPIEWKLTELTEHVEIDRRQRLAAAMLIMGFDLPQDLMRASQSMLQAADVCPGLNTGEMVMGASGQRRANLKAARDLIDDMLAETAKAGEDPRQP